MPGFLNDHADMMKTIKKPCKFLNNLRDKFEHLYSSLDGLTYMQEELKNTVSKFYELNPKSELNRMKMEKLEQSLKVNFDEYAAILSATTEKLSLQPDISAITSKIDKTTHNSRNNIEKSNRKAIEIKFSEELYKDPLRLYKATVAEDYNQKKWHTMKFKSTAEYPLAIEISSDNDSTASCKTKDQLYRHDIQSVTRSETQIFDPSTYDELIPLDGFESRVELVAVNGRYLKELNREEIEPILNNEINTGKVVLDVVRDIYKLHEEPNIAGFTVTAMTAMSLST